MPPNRKGTFENVDNLATLNVAAFVTTSKYQPLTSLQHEHAAPSPFLVVGEEAKAVEGFNDNDDHQFPITTASHGHQTNLLNQIVEQERLRQQFTVDHVIETTLQNNYEVAEVPMQHAATTAKNDNNINYWDEETPENQSELRAVHTVKSKHVDQDYWMWPERPSKQEEKEAVIRRILLEEKNRELLSVTTVEQQIRKEAFQLASVSSTKPKSPSQNDAYWAWETPASVSAAGSNDTLTPEEKNSVIQNILEAERIRQQLSAATIEEQLTREAKKLPTEQKTCIAANDDYWAHF